MRVSVGAGWHLYHLTDRVVELRKDDPVYRRFTGRDGYVKTRVDTNETRQTALERAIRMAQKNDELLAVRVGKQLMPSKAALARYQGKQLRMVPAFGLRDQEPEYRVYRP